MYLLYGPGFGRAVRGGGRTSASTGPCCGSCATGCGAAQKGADEWAGARGARGSSCPPCLSLCTAAGVCQHPPLPGCRLHAPKNDKQLPSTAAPPQPEGLCLQGGHSQWRVPVWGPLPAPLPPAPPGPARSLLANSLGSGTACHQPPQEHRPAAMATAR